jgi:hypothetical protein
MDKIIQLLNAALDSNEAKRHWVLNENKDKSLKIASNRIKEAIEIIESYNN